MLKAITLFNDLNDLLWESVEILPHPPHYLRHRLNPVGSLTLPELKELFSMAAAFDFPVLPCICGSGFDLGLQFYSPDFSGYPNGHPPLLLTVAQSHFPSELINNSLTYDRKMDSIHQWLEPLINSPANLANLKREKLLSQLKPLDYYRY